VTGRPLRAQGPVGRRTRYCSIRRDSDAGGVAVENLGPAALQVQSSRMTRSWHLDELRQGEASFESAKSARLIRKMPPYVRRTPERGRETRWPTTAVERAKANAHRPVAGQFLV